MTTPTQPQPSPRPWKATSSANVKDARDAQIAQTTMLIPELTDHANADLIVRAVNHHDELVEALEAINGCISHCDTSGEFVLAGKARTLQVLSLVRAVLAKVRT